MTDCRIGLVLILALAGCATQGTTFRTGKQLIEAGRYEEGLQAVNTAVKANPQNIEYRAYYVRNRDSYIGQLLTSGDKQRLLGRPEDAEPFYTRVLALDTGNTRAQAGLAEVKKELRHRTIAAEARTLLEAGDLDGAQARLRPVLAENPQQHDARAVMRSIEEQRTKTLNVGAVLKSTLRKPVTLEFREALLKNVFEVLSRTSGINFLFDKDVRPDLKTTIFVRDTRIEDAIRFLLTTNQLEMKVLNDTTILVYPNLPNKLKDYQELTVKSFYLANADVKQTLNLIKTVVKTRDVFIDERLNMLTMRDTPEAIRMAEKLIAAQDLAEPEVMLELEVLEVGRNRLTLPDATQRRDPGGGRRRQRHAGRNERQLRSAYASEYYRSGDHSQPAASRQRYQSARQSAHSRQEPREGQSPHRRQAAGHHDDVDCQCRRVGVGYLPRCRIEARHRAERIP